MGTTPLGYTLFSVMGIDGGVITRELGSVSFNTASPARGLGLPSGLLFSSTFSGPVSWTLVSVGGGTHNYSVTGVAVGAIVGHLVNAVTVQLTINASAGYLENATLLAGGDTKTVSSVPEPSTLALLLTGSVGTLGMMWRKRLTYAQRTSTSRIRLQRGRLHCNPLS